MSTFGIHGLNCLMVRALSSFDTLRNMKALQVIEEVLNRVFKWHGFPVSPKAEAILLYFKELSLRAVGGFLLYKSYEVYVYEIKYKTTNYPLEEREIMWVKTIDKLLKDENLRKDYSEKAKQRAEDFRIEKTVQE